jgi:hypothetical protein
MLEQDLDARVAAGYGPLDPKTSKLIDEEADWVGEGITKGLVHPVETARWVWDFGQLMGIAASLMHRVSSASQGRHVEPGHATAYLGSATARSESLETRAGQGGPEQAETGNSVRRVIGWRCLQKIAATCRSDENPALRLVWERFSITLLADAISRADSGALRLIMLADRISQVQPSEGTLHQVGQPCCQFVWGFDLECAIACRAVLEDAFHKLVAEDSADQASHRPSAHGLRFEECGALLCERGILSAEALGAIRQVGQLAERALQGRLFDPERALEAVCGTITVLEQIGGREPHAAGVTSC